MDQVTTIMCSDLTRRCTAIKEGIRNFMHHCIGGLDE